MLLPLLLLLLQQLPIITLNVITIVTVPMLILCCTLTALLSLLPSQRLDSDYSSVRCYWYCHFMRDCHYCAVVGSVVVVAIAGAGVSIAAVVVVVCVLSLMLLF